MSSVTREQIIGLLKVAACPASCDNGVVVRDQLHGEIEQCQFCFEREQAIAALQEASPASVPEGWKLVPVEPTLGMLAALAWAGDEDLALGHAEINREIISNYGAMLTASPTPEHSGDSNEMPGWEPIETAPMDGTYIQLYRPKIQFVGYYGGANSGWRHNAPGLDSVWPLPTHWMPLHNPPRQEDAER